VHVPYEFNSSAAADYAATANVHFGGTGLYMSLKDYLTLLRHLLQVKGSAFLEAPMLFTYYVSSSEGKATNAIITEASVMMLLEPTLPEPAMASLAKMMGSPAGAAQYGRGLMLETADLPGRRKKGSGSCRPLGIVYAYGNY
jgi:hypothetical protein